jgi:HEAT repeat protein
MQMDAESALPILRQVLAKRDACSVELRKQAVFMVSQKQGEESARILLQTARNDPSSDVRADAIQWLGQSRSDIAIPALDSILNSSGDNDVREKAIFALSQQRDPSASQVIRRFVENERVPDDLRANGIFWLGQRRDAVSAEYLRQLYSRTRSEQLHESIIQAISQSKDSDASRWLIDIASDREQPVESRKNALFWASQQHQIDFARLSSFYDNAKGQGDLQEHVIWLLSQRREPEATDKLMDIAVHDPNKERRGNAIFWLGQKKDPRVVKFLLDLITK